MTFVAVVAVLLSGCASQEAPPTTIPPVPEGFFNDAPAVDDAPTEVLPEAAQVKTLTDGQALAIFNEYPEINGEPDSEIEQFADSFCDLFEISGFYAVGHIMELSIENGASEETARELMIYSTAWKCPTWTSTARVAPYPP
ncbi:hypothetical protein K0651_13280 [Ornithinimicrobium sp. Arc0846-15]|nr:hypothetical protein [Ornithinimicrobium laminariae]